MSENLEKTYNPKAIEAKLYEKWCDNKYFHAEVDRSKKPFTTVMPPPNITGKLHMGHALDNTLQDILIRYKRMQGYNALWIPGTDHAAISTEVKVTNQLKGEGIYGFAENMKSAASALQRSMCIGLQAETGMSYGYDFKTGKYDFTNWADTLKLWTELLSEECAFPGCESLDIDPLRTQFAAGKIGMYMSYSHSEPGVYANQFPMDSSKWDVAPIPTVGGKTTGKQYYDGTSSYMFNADSPNLEKAFKAYKDIFTTEEYLIGYYEGGYGVSILPSILEKANPSEDFKNKKWLQINPETDAILPKPPHRAFTSGMIVEGEDMFKTAESIYYGGADVESTLQDLTDRYNKAYEDAIANGTGWEIKFDNYDPMNPTLE